MRSPSTAWVSETAWEWLFKTRNDFGEDAVMVDNWNHDSLECITKSLPVLHLCDCVSGVFTNTVGEDTESNELHVEGTAFYLVLSHARQVQLAHIWDDTHCSC